MQNSSGDDILSTEEEIIINHKNIQVSWDKR
jgi:hypothetical protein